MKRLLISLVATVMAIAPICAKKQLDHSSFDDWKNVRINTLSNDGSWAVYRISPQEGDAQLVVRNVKTGKEYLIERGDKPSFTADSKWLVARIKPLFKDTRQAKIDKKKDFDMPQDSLAILNLKTGNIEKIARLIDYKVGEKGGEWVAYTTSDTTLISEKALKDKEVGRPLVMLNLPSNRQKTLKWVKDFTFSKDGKRIALNTVPHSTDSTATTTLGVVNLPDTAFILLDREKKHYGAPVFSEDGTKLAYTATNDTVKTGTRRMQLYMAKLDTEIPESTEVTVPDYAPTPNLALPHSADHEKQKELDNERSELLAKYKEKGLYMNQYTVPSFSRDGRRLITGVAPIVAPDDTTIVDFERADLDIWRWDAPMTPPQEKHLLKQIRENQFPVVIDLDTRKAVLTTDKLLAEVKPGNRYDSDWVLISDPTDTYYMKQWDYIAPKKLYVKNIVTGEQREVGDAPMDEGNISPNGGYVYWYADRNFHVYDIATGKTVNVTKAIPYPVWDEEQDIPLARQQYKDPWWSKDDEALIVADRFDLWSVDPKGEREPICLTMGEGRKNNLTFRPVKLDDEFRYFSPGDKMVLKVFDNTDKRNGLATMTFGKPQKPSIKMLDGFEYVQLRKAKDADSYAFVKDNFSVSPDVYLSANDNFAKAVKVTDINPQMKEYSWGTAQLERWYGYDGRPLEGVLYVPEDFDPAKKYPMLVVFYETGSQYLYHHYEMEPSWSWINYPFYVSRGYVVFQPDVRYTPGVPGEGAYNCVCSGVEELCKRYPWIDKERVGIDGQSWGGYQTAYLVTRTDMFACAGSGAPVANMTSAFGGIRWGTGDSRQAQYEVGQSRIGRNLWDSKELYIANSPLFYADRINTPLLIMHNDEDGAVPWYQGIELFMALRRLHKPVWMLQYNGEAHNIKERKNRKDITIRLQQFFDHYLQGAPMPRWMETGIPAIRKGQDLGY